MHQPHPPATVMTPHNHSLDLTQLNIKPYILPQLFPNLFCSASFLSPTCWPDIPTNRPWVFPSSFSSSKSMILILSTELLLSGHAHTCPPQAPASTPSNFDLTDLYPTYWLVTVNPFNSILHSAANQPTWFPLHPPFCSTLKISCGSVGSSPLTL